MVIVRNFDQLSDLYPSCVLTLGNFDGVHLGHRALFRRLVFVSRELSCPSVVCTFAPHPLKVIAPDKAPPLLNTPAEKRRLIAASHVDYLVEIPFTNEFSSLPPEAFVDSVLIGKLKVEHLIVGYDYAFGKGRRGDAQFLKEFGAKRGIHVDVLQPVGSDGQPFSSTRIRNLLFEGDVAAVVDLLGRQYNLEGTVVPGDQRGRKMGFPTANISTEKELLPAPGVYVVKVRYGTLEYGAVVNLGTRPTFEDGGRATIEVHLLDFTGDLYGETLRIYFIDRLRGELKFNNMSELSDAIEKDVLAARQILPTVNVVQYQEYLSLKSD